MRETEALIEAAIHGSHAGYRAKVPFAHHTRGVAAVF